LRGGILTRGLVTGKVSTSERRLLASFIWFVSFVLVKQDQLEEQNKLDEPDRLDWAWPRLAGH
jgi:hypothetical protein